MCFTAKPAVVCELSTRYEAAISISEASCMGCSSLCRWDAVGECRFVQQVQNTFPDQEQWISICCRVVHAVAEPHSSCSGQQLRKAQAELAHLSRVMTMRELRASIAHEVKQPLAAIVSSGQWVPAMARPRRARRRRGHAAVERSSATATLMKSALSGRAPTDACRWRTGPERAPSAEDIIAASCAAATD